MTTQETSARSVIITGAGGGIGVAIASAFRAEGARLFLNDLRSPESTGDDTWIVGDVRDADVAGRLVAAATAATGSVDVLVNAAGIQLRKAAVDVHEEEWQNLLGINLSAAYALIRLAVPALEHSGGNIVNIASLSASHVIPNIVPYGATKAALTQLTKGLAAELGPVGVRVNAVDPGHIHTPMTAQNLAKVEVRDRLLPRIPLGRFGEADEIAAAVTWLASDRARYVTGAVLAVDGGYSVT